MHSVRVIAFWAKVEIGATLVIELVISTLFTVRNVKINYHL